MAANFHELAKNAIAAVESGDLPRLRSILQSSNARALLLADHKYWTSFPDSSNDGAKVHSGDRPLHRACRRGRREMVISLVEEFNNPFKSYFNNRGAIPINLAAENGHLEIVRYFLKIDPKLVEAKDADNDTPLNRASAGGTVEVMRYLVESKKCNLESCGIQGMTALLHACYRGRVNAARYLIEKGANVNAKCSEERSNESAIHLASEKGHVSIVMLLLEINPAFLEIEDSDMKTPLNSAVAGGSLELVRYLVEEKFANLEHHDSYGGTPLLQACSLGRVKIIQYLVSKGANYYARLDRSFSSWTPIHLAIDNGHLAAVEYLISVTPYFLRVVDSNGNCALIFAALNGRHEIVKFLVEKKQADVKRCNLNGRTALMVACRNGHLITAKFLLESGSVLEAVDSSREKASAYHLAAYHGHVEILKLLLDFKPSLLNVKSGAGKTALIYAIEQ